MPDADPSYTRIVPHRLPTVPTHCPEGDRWHLPVLPMLYIARFVDLGPGSGTLVGPRTVPIHKTDLTPALPSPRDCLCHPPPPLHLGITSCRHKPLFPSPSLLKLLVTVLFFPLSFFPCLFFHYTAIKLDVCLLSLSSFHSNSCSFLPLSFCLASSLATTVVALTRTVQTKRRRRSAGIESPTKAIPDALIRSPRCITLRCSFWSALPAPSRRPFGRTTPSTTNTSRC